MERTINLRGAAACPLLVLSAAAASVFCLLTARPAHATPPGEIVLGDITVMRLRVGSGKLDLQQRGDLVQDRINQILAIKDVTAKDVTVVQEKAGPTIYVRKIKLITIDKPTADAAQTDPLTLAKMWAHRLAGIVDQVNVMIPASRIPKPETPAAPPAETPPATAPASTPPATPETPAPPTAPPAAPAAPAAPPQTTPEKGTN